MTTLNKKKKTINISAKLPFIDNDGNVNSNYISEHNFLIVKFCIIFI